MKNIIVITDKKQVEEWSVDELLTHISMMKSVNSWEFKRDMPPTLERMYDAPIQRITIDGKDYLIAVFPGAADEQEVIEIVRSHYY
ncbi:hypothetical protein [Pseudocitrobacter sp. 73]|uniref:hypothetical protein n=1 Tax=Pseudocitrobacter sp. 73 TaxID=2605731 RepID=UPI0011EC4280|nr:hypothetical protein [Pseudocitrobacter sp. 73]KAA1047296.1 hypothetical protein F0Q32_20485 [Pseudocitrobacter sp. 73]